MDTYNKIRELDSEIHSILEKNTPMIFDLLKTIEIPKTAKTLFLFIAKTNLIKSGIFKLYESQNYYSINILMRSLIEHFLKFQYIFIRLGLDKNDTVGEDYIKFCSYSENIDTGKAWKNVAKIIDKDPGLDPYDLIKEINTDLKLYSKQEIIDKSSQFRYMSIIRFITKKLSEKKKNTNIEFLLKVIPNYSDLSSFVHGGPTADKIVLENYSKDIMEKELIRIIEITFSITASIIHLTFLIFYQHEEKFGKAYLEIENLMKKNNH